MNEYTKAQSTVIALWVLAADAKGRTAPEVITTLVNDLGPPHSPDSILLHTHGYDILLLGRKYDKTITSLQRTIASELFKQGVAEFCTQ